MEGRQGTYRNFYDFLPFPVDLKRVPDFKIIPQQPSLTPQQLTILLNKFLEGTASAAEEDLLLRYYEACGQQSSWDEPALGSPEAMEQAIWQKLHQQLSATPVIPLYRRGWIQAIVAASVVLAVALAGWWPPAPAPQVSPTPAPTVFKPVAVRVASLVLSDGRVQSLTDNANGVLAEDGAYAIRQKGHLLVYSRQFGKKPDAAAAYHVLSLPAGSQYAVQLPDGSKVWLNATSVLRFPLYFSPAERRVELQGEAYFEVAKDPHRPFVVQPVGADGRRRGAVVEVLGTHFNVEAYGDEPLMRTTLLEGKVRLHPGTGGSAVLAPGQQALALGNKPLTIATVDVERVVAWQRGLFDFKGAGTRQVLHQLARWYGLEVHYGRINDALRFSGKISRRMALADVLEILEQSGLRCTLQNKVIRVGTGM